MKLQLKLRWQMFRWRLRNREFWNRGAVKHWWDWFAIDPAPGRVPKYKMRKYKRWLVRFNQANRIIPTTRKEEWKFINKR